VITDGTGCNSDSSDPIVVAARTKPPKPIVDLVGSKVLCGTNTASLLAPSGYSIYQWSGGETVAGITVTAAGSYSVVVGNFASCLSPASDTVRITASPKPTKPIVQAGGPTELCGGSTVTLDAPSGFSYLWSTGANTQQIATNATGNFSVMITNGSGCNSDLSDPIAVVARTRPLKPKVDIVGSTELCGTNSASLLAPSGYSIYQWSGGEKSQGITVNATGSYSVVVGNFASCLSPASDAATFTSSPKPTKPIVQASGTTALCDGSTVTLNAPAGFSYLWSSGPTTQKITVKATGNYSVIITDGSGCSSDSSDPTAVVAYTRPQKPSIDVFGSTVLCGTNTAGLLAPPGYSIYQWSGGETLQGITVIAAASYSVVVGNIASCLSPVSDAVIISATNQPCGGGAINLPPVVDAKPLAGTIEGKVIVDLTKLVSDPDGNIDFNSLRVVGSITSRGAPAFVSALFELIVDYGALPFTGIDRITIEVCDLGGACVQQVIDIEVAGAVKIYNGLTPDGDGHNDFMFIKYVEVVEGAADNTVTIFNRWGDVVWEVEDYDNDQRVFRGLNKKGSELPSGTYFYKIQLSGANKPLTGFITLLR
jgi:gliding motility-associated-like protein